MFLVFILVLWAIWIAFWGFVSGFFGFLAIGLFLPLGVLWLFSAIFGKLIRMSESAPRKRLQQARAERRAVHWIGLDGVEVAALGYRSRLARSAGIMHTVSWMLDH